MMGVELERVSKVYQAGEVEVQALKNVSLQFPDGEITVILGPSGSGKSTLLNIIGGIDRATTGSVTINGTNITVLKDRELTDFRRRNAAFIFQSYNLLPSLTVRENVEVGSEISENPLSIEEVLERVGMLSKADKFPHQLSGGEQQRVAIARALVKNPNLLFCDEPTGALDEETGKRILTLLQEINEKYKTSIFIITHNPGISEMAHRVIKMKSGEVVEEYRNHKPIRAESVRWV